MTPITQTETGDEGNCFSACLASILHVPLSEVPNFYKDDDKTPEAWWKRVRAWIAPHGFGVVHMTVDVSNVENPLHWYHPEAYLIVSGKSERGIDHATIWRGGKMVHDPHPSRGGIKAPESLDLLYPLDPSEITRLRTLSVEHIMLDVVPGDGDGHEVYAKSVDDVVKVLGDLWSKAEDAQEEVERLRAELETEMSRLDFVLSRGLFTYTKRADSGCSSHQLLEQNEDEEYIVVSGDGRFFATPREAIDAAIAAVKGEE